MHFQVERYEEPFYPRHKNGHWLLVKGIELDPEKAREWLYKVVSSRKRAFRLLRRGRPWITGKYGDDGVIALTEHIIPARR